MLAPSEPAHKLYVATLAWRRTHSPWLMENTDTREDKMACDARVVGFDRQVRGWMLTGVQRDWGVPVDG